ncbi:MAG TPA: GNAT family N-acetyltransferase [Mobilitalea sp.]|nr:GNAT family N-acetyltransferase [Mobilitalea sp.]
MEITLREYRREDIPYLMAIWNAVVEEANAFPQVTCLEERQATEFFAAQTYTGVAELDGEVVGLYILHPNNIGRCGHIANASYAVKAGCRGNKVGEQLVRDSLRKGREFGFKIMQFNAVVSINSAAIHLYEKIGFHRLGIIPNGFQLGDGSYTDIILYYILLE